MRLMQNINSIFVIQWKVAEKQPTVCTVPWGEFWQKYNVSFWLTNTLDWKLITIELYNLLQVRMYKSFQTKMRNFHFINCNWTIVRSRFNTNITLITKKHVTELKHQEHTSEIQLSHLSRFSRFNAKQSDTWSKLRTEDSYCNGQYKTISGNLVHFLG
jgi:hypothetical protein